MKNFVSIFVFLLVLAACGGSDDTTGGVISQEYINVESELTIAAQETTKTFTIDANCHWSITVTSVWEGLVIDPREGDGKRTVTITTPANRTITDRTATLTVSSQAGIKKNITLTQPNGGASLALSETEHTFDAAGGKWAFTITSNTSWTVSGASEGFSYDKTSGTGNASVEVTAADNTSESPRSLVLTITAGTEKAEVTIIQDPKTTISITPKSINAESTGGTFQIEVQSNADWLLISDKNWVVASTSTGTVGKTELSLTCAANPDPTPRNATITITSGSEKAEVAITQKATTILSVTPTRINAEAAGGTFQIEVQSNADWMVTSNQNWLTASTSNGTGNGQLSLTCTANPNTTPRTAVITITAGSETAEVTVTQAEFVYSLVVSPKQIESDALEKTYNIQITSNTSWSATSSHQWATIEPTTGSGDGTLTLRCADNISTSSRSTTITIIAATLTETVIVTQKGASKPTITDIAVIDLSSNSATITAKYASTKYPVTEYGVYYGTNADPTTSGTKVSFTGNALSGGISVPLNNLATGTTYYVCVYATSAIGTQISVPISFISPVSRPGTDDNDTPNLIKKK